MRAIPRLWRLAVLRACDAGQPTRQVAKQYHCSESWVRRIKQHRRELGKYGPYRTRYRDRHGGTLKERVGRVLIEAPDIPAQELERLFGAAKSPDLLVIIRDELFIQTGIWHAPDWSPSPLPSDCTEKSNSPNIGNVRELLLWRPDLTFEELQRVFGTELSSSLVAGVKTGIDMLDLGYPSATKRSTWLPYAANPSTVVRSNDPRSDGYPCL